MFRLHKEPIKPTFDMLGRSFGYPAASGIHKMKSSKFAAFICINFPADVSRKPGIRVPIYADG
jgi:hypothetical protein